MPSSTAPEPRGAPRGAPRTPPQQFVCDAGLLTSGFSAVLQMPTGSGKTWLAEQAIAHVIAQGSARDGARAIYLAPLRALAAELAARWQRRFAPHPVGVFTGDAALQLAPQDGTTIARAPKDARVLVMTPERFDAILRAWRSHWGWLPSVDLVVADELHLLGEPGRGARLEAALLRFRRLNPCARVLGLSATLGNAHELAAWLDGVAHVATWRPVPLTWRTVAFKQASDKPALLAREVARAVQAGGRSLVFAQSRRRTETLAAGLRAAGLRAGHHHAGLEHAERARVEHAFRTGALDVLVATSTVEMGVNLPARQVVLYDLSQFDGAGFTPLPVNAVHQRAGRAGRPGLDDAGEAVLLAPAWDRGVDYARAPFEPIRSQLAQPAALAECLVADVAAGFARTRAQAVRALAGSLAAHQGAALPVAATLDTMLAAGMLTEARDEGPDDAGGLAAEGASAVRGLRLRATRLGRIATRHLLTPATVLTLRTLLAGEGASAPGQAPNRAPNQAPNQAPATAPDPATLTFFDLLLALAATGDATPVLPVDFESLEDLAARLRAEPSALLALPGSALAQLAGDHTGAGPVSLGGRRLLAALRMALVLRDWTRLGDAARVAEEHGCYPFEVRRLAESAERLLLAMRELVTPPQTDPTAAPRADTGAAPRGPADAVPLAERIAALLAMVRAGVDEQTATLLAVPGIGPTHAGRLRAAGVADIEDLADADPGALAVPRVAPARLAAWIAAAGTVVDTSSAYRYRETGAAARATHAPAAWPIDVDPYRFRRALDLTARPDAADVGRECVTYTVSGGLEPHQVVSRDGAWTCDCADAAKTTAQAHARLHADTPACKHVLAVRLARGDAALRALADRITGAPGAPQAALDLAALWLAAGGAGGGTGARRARR